MAVVCLAGAVVAGSTSSPADEVSGEGKRLGLRRTTVTAQEQSVDFEDRRASTDTLQRSSGTARVDGTVVLEVDLWSVASPYTDQWRLCFSLHPSLPCLDIKQEFPEVRGETINHAVFLVDRDTLARFVVSLGPHTLYNGALNTHYEELADTRNIPLAIPKDVRRAFEAELGGDGSHRTRIVLDWLRLLYDQAKGVAGTNRSGEATGWSYGELPLLHGFIALDVSFALMRDLFGEAPADEELSDVSVDEFELVVEPMVMEPAPADFLQRQPEMNVR